MDLQTIKYFILLSSIFVPLFWAIVMLFSKNRTEGGNKFLVLLFVNITFEYFMTFNRYFEHFNIYSTLFPLQVFAVLNSFPLFYLYFTSVTNPSKNKIKGVIYHFILSFVLGLTFYVLMYIFMSSHERYLFISEHLYNKSIDLSSFNIGYFLYRGGKLLYILQSCFYFFFIFKKNIKH